MATTPGSSRTAPKGHATRAQSDDAEGRSFFGPTMQWIIVVVACLAVAGGIMYFARDVGPNVGGGGHGAPVEVVVDLTADPFAA